MLVRVFRLSKHAYQQVRFSQNVQQTVLFILGSQRSGTSLMRRILERDWSIKVYGEHGELSTIDRDHRSRLKSLASVKEALDEDRAPLVVLKPLLESQDSLKLLNYFPESKALWMYRNHKDVALSHVRFFGPSRAINDLQALAQNKIHEWRSENIPGSVRETVLEHFSKDMDPFAAAALFWYVRNSLFFALRLEEDSRVMLIKYEDFVTAPDGCLRRIYGFVGRGYPGRKTVREVHARAIGKGSEVRLSPSVEDLCCNLLDRIESAYQTGLGSSSRGIAWD